VWFEEPLQMRRTALRRSTKRMKRSKLRKKSKKQIEREKRYWPAQKEVILRDPLCKVCLSFGRTTPATEAHHLRGRNGSLLWDTRFMIGTCFWCRMWPHDNKEEARKRGLLCKIGEWGIAPK